MLANDENRRGTRAAITEHLLSQIVRGELPAGSRLPTRRDLSNQFGVSSVTVQRAMDTLMRDGFAYSTGANGTFVSPHPPHLCRYGLVFASHPGDALWRRFNTVLVDQALRFQAPTRRLAVYYGIDRKREGAGYRQLVSDLRGDRLVGLIIGGSPADFAGTLVVESVSKPRVLLMEEPGSVEFPAVGHDVHAFVDHSLDHLQAKGCTRVAVITGEKPAGANFVEYFRAAAARRRLEHRPYWMQGVHVSGAHLARNLTQLLMHPGQEVRPDGLIICDDNLAEHALAGLRDLGISSPNELKIVVHANFPASMPSTMPIHRVGYDAYRTLDMCVDLIDRQRRGEHVSPLTLVPAVAEDEFTRPHQSDAACASHHHIASEAAVVGGA